MEKIGLKPSGLKGILAGLIMNSLHARQYKKIIQGHIINICNSSDALNVLDIGCGGGTSVAIFSSMLQSSRIFGIDHSAEMVTLSRKVNKKGIANGLVDINQGSASKLTFPDKYFDIITAFDTINFWDDIFCSVSEIKRVLKQDGVFFIVNGYPKYGTKWHKFVKFKDDQEYRYFLNQFGFKDIEIIIENHTIIIRAKK